MHRKVPFYSNTKDDTHCFQASLKMVMGHFWPQKKYSWKELDRISAKKKGLWTWPLAALVWLAKNGMEIRNIEVFDYQAFIKEGGKYLIEFLGHEVGEAQIAHSDIDQERRLSRTFIKAIRIEKRLPALRDIKLLTNEGFLVGCNVNARTLNRKKGYAGHFMVIVGSTKNHLILHDPGLPPRKYRKVSFGQFEKAWAYPDKKAKNIMAFRAR